MFAGGEVCVSVILSFDSEIYIKHHVKEQVTCRKLKICR